MERYGMSAVFEFDGSGAIADIHKTATALSQLQKQLQDFHKQQAKYDKATGGGLGGLGGGVGGGRGSKRNDDPLKGARNQIKAISKEFRALRAEATNIDFGDLNDPHALDQGRKAIARYIEDLKQLEKQVDRATPEGRTLAANLQRQQTIANTRSAVATNQRAAAIASQKQGMAAGVAATGAAIAVPLITAGKGAVETFAKFEDQMSTIAAVSRVSEKDLDKFRQQAKELGATSRYAASEVGGAQEFFVRAGFSLRDTIAAVPSTLALASSDGIDIATAGDISSNILGQFGMAAEETARLNNLLANTSSQANTNVLELGEAFKMIGPLAKDANLNAEETAAMFGIAGNVGIKATSAGTGIRSGLVNFADEKKQKMLAEIGVSVTTPDGKFRNSIDIIGDLRKALGKDFEDPAFVQTLRDSGEDVDAVMAKFPTQAKGMQVLSKVFGKTAVSFWTSQIGQYDRLQRDALANLGASVDPELLMSYFDLDPSSEKDVFEQILTQAGDYQTAVVLLDQANKDLQKQYPGMKGVAEIMAARREDNLAGSFRSLGSALEGLQLELVAPLEPVLRKITDTITALTRSFSSLSPPIKSAISIGVALVAVLGSVLAIGGAIAVAYFTLQGAIASAAVAMATLEGAAIPLTGFFATSMEAIAGSGVAGLFGTLGSAITGFATGPIGMAIAAFGGLLTIAQILAPTFNVLGGVLAVVSGLVGALWGTITGFVGAMKSALAPVIADFQALIAVIFPAGEAGGYLADAIAMAGSAFKVMAAIGAKSGAIVGGALGTGIATVLRSIIFGIKLVVGAFRLFSTAARAAIWMISAPLQLLVFGPIAWVLRGVRSLWQGFTSAATRIQSAWQGFVDWFKKMPLVSFALDIADKLIDALNHNPTERIPEAWDSAIARITDTMDLLLLPARLTAQAISSIFRLGTRIVAGAWHTLAGWFDRLQLTEWASTAGDAISDFLRDPIAVIKSTWQRVTGWFDRLAITDWAAIASSQITDFLSNPTDTISDAWTGFTDWLGTLPIAGWASDLGLRITDLLSNPTDTIAQVWQQFTGWLGRLPISDWAATVGTAVGDLLSNPTGWIADTWQQFTGWLGRLPIAQWATDTANGVLIALTHPVETIATGWEWLTDALGLVMDGIADTAQSIGGAIADTLNPSKLLGGFVDGAIGMLEGVVDAIANSGLGTILGKMGIDVTGLQDTISSFKSTAITTPTTATAVATERPKRQRFHLPKLPSFAPQPTAQSTPSAIAIPDFRAQINQEVAKWDLPELDLPPFNAQDAIAAARRAGSDASTTLTTSLNQGISSYRWGNTLSGAIAPDAAQAQTAITDLGDGLATFTIDAAKSLATLNFSQTQTAAETLAATFKAAGAQGLAAFATLGISAIGFGLAGLMSLSPVLLVIGGVGLAVAAVTTNFLGLRTIFGGVIQVIKGGIQVVMGVVDAIAAIARTAKGVADGVVKVFRGIPAALRGDFSQMAAGFDAIWGSLKSGASGLAAAWHKIFGGLETITRGFGQIVRGVAEGIRQAITGTIAIAKGSAAAAKLVGQGIGAAFNFASALPGQMQSIAERVTAAWHDLTANLKARPITVATDALKAIPTLISGIGDRAAALWRGAVDAIARLVPHVDLAPIRAVPDRIGAIADRSMTAWRSLTSWFADAVLRPDLAPLQRVGGVIDGVVAAVKSGWQAIKNVLGAVLPVGAIAAIERAEGVAAAAGDRIRTGWSAAMDAIRQIVPTIDFSKITALPDKLRAATDGAIAIWHGLTSAIAQPLRIGLAALEGLPGQVKAIAERATATWDGLRNGLAATMDAIAGIFRGATEQIEAMWRGLADRILAPFNAVKETAKGIGKKLVSFLSENSPGPTFQIRTKWAATTEAIQGNLSGLAIKSGEVGKRMASGLGDRATKGLSKLSGGFSQAGVLLSNFSPALAGPLFMLGDFADAASMVGENLPALKKGFAGVIGKVGSLGSILPALGSGLAAMGGSAIAAIAPLLPFIGIAAAIGGAAFLLYKAFKSNFLGIRTVVESSLGAVRNVMSFFASAFQFLLSPLQMATNTIKGAWDGFSGWFGGVMDRIPGFARDAGSQLIDALNHNPTVQIPIAWETAKTRIQDSISGLVPEAQSVAGDLVSAFKDKSVAVADAIQSSLGGSIASPSVTAPAIASAPSASGTITIPVVVDTSTAATTIQSLRDRANQVAADVRDAFSEMMDLRSADALAIAVGAVGGAAESAGKSFKAMMLGAIAAGIASLASLSPVVLVAGGLALAGVAIATNFLGVRTILKGIGKIAVGAFQSVIAIIEGAIATIQTVIGTIKGLLVMIGGIPKAIRGDFSQISAGADQIGSAFRSGFFAIQAAGDRLASGLRTIFSGMGTISDGIGQAFKQVGAAIAGVGRVATQSGRLLGAGLEQGIGILKGLPDQVGAIAQGIRQRWQSVIQFVQGTVLRPDLAPMQRLGAIADATLAGLKATWQRLTELIGAAVPIGLQPGLARLGEIASGIFDRIHQGWKSLTVAISGWVPKINLSNLGTIPDKLSAIGDHAIAVWRSTSDRIGSLLNSVAPVAAIAFDKIKGAIATAEQAVRSGVDGVISTFHRIGDVVATLTSTVIGKFDALRVNISGVADAIAAPFVGAIEKITGLWSGMTEKVGGFFGKLTGKARGAGQELVSALAENSPGPTFQIRQKWGMTLEKIEAGMNNLSGHAQGVGNRIGGAIGGASSHFSKLSGGLSQAGVLLSNFSPALAGPLFMLGDFADAASMVADNLPGLKDKLKAVGGVSGLMGKGLTIAKGGFSAIAATAGTMGSAIAGSVAAALPALGALATSAGSALMAIAAPLLPFIAGAAAVVAAVVLIRKAFNSNFLGIRDVSERVIQSVGSGLSFLTSMVLWPITTAIAKIRGAVDLVKGAWQLFSDGFGTVVGAVVTPAKTIGQKLVNFLNHGAADETAAAWTRTRDSITEDLTGLPDLAATTSAQISKSLNIASPDATNLAAPTVESTPTAGAIAVPVVPDYRPMQQLRNQLANTVASLGNTKPVQESRNAITALGDQWQRLTRINPGDAIATGMTAVKVAAGHASGALRGVALSGLLAGVAAMSGLSPLVLVAAGLAIAAGAVLSNFLGLRTIAAGLGKIVGGAFTIIGAAIDATLAIVKMAIGIFRGFGEVLTGIPAALRGDFSRIQSGLDTITGAAKSGFAALQAAGDRAVSGLKGLGSGLRQIGQGLGEALDQVKGAVSGAIAAISGLPDRIKAIAATATTIWHGLTSAIAQPLRIGMAALEALPGQVGAIAERATATWDGLRGGLTATMDAIAGIFRGATEQIEAMWRGLADRILAPFNAVKDTAKGIGKKLVSFLSENSPGPTFQIRLKWQQTGEAIAAQMHQMQGTAIATGKKMVSSLSVGSRLGKLSGGFSRVGGALAGISPQLAGPLFLLGDLADMGEMAVKGLPKLAKKFTELGGAAGLMSKGVKLAKSGIGMMASLFGMIASGVSAAAAAIAPLVSTVIAAGSSMIAAIAPVIVPILPIIAAVAGVAVAAIALRKAWKSNFLGIRKITANVFGTISSVVGAATMPIRMIVSVIQGAIATIQSAWSMFSGGFGGVLGAVLAPAKSIGEKLVGFLNHGAADVTAAAWTRTRDSFIADVNVLPDTAATAGTAIAANLSVAPDPAPITGFGGAIASLKATATGALDSVRSALGGVAGGFVQVAIAAIPTLLPILAVLGGVALAITAIATNFLGVRTILKGLITAAQLLWSGFKQVFSGIVRIVQGAVNVVRGIFAGLKGDWSLLRIGLDQLRSGFATVFGGLVSIVQAPIAIIRGILNGFVQAIRQMWTAVKPILGPFGDIIEAPFRSAAIAVKDVLSKLELLAAKVGSVGAAIANSPLGKLFGGGKKAAAPAIAPPAIAAPKLAALDQVDAKLSKTATTAARLSDRAGKAQGALNGVGAIAGAISPQLAGPVWALSGLLDGVMALLPVLPGAASLMATFGLGSTAASAGTAALGTSAAAATGTVTTLGTSSVATGTAVAGMGATTVTAGGIMSAVFGAIATAAGAMWAAITGPLLPIIAGVALIIGLFVLIKKNVFGLGDAFRVAWQSTIAPFWEGIRIAIATVRDAFGSITRTIAEAFGVKAQGSLNLFGTILTAVFTVALLPVRILAIAIGGIAKIVGSVLAVIIKAIAVILKVVLFPVRLIMGAIAGIQRAFEVAAIAMLTPFRAIGSVFGWLGSLVSSLGSALRSTLDVAIAPIQWIGSALSAIGSTVASVIGGAGQAIAALLQSLWNIIPAPIRWMVEQAAAGVGWILGALGGGDRANPNPVEPQRFASGGLVQGVGGPTSDRVPALLSPNEFVVNAAAAAQHLPLLESMNSGNAIAAPAIMPMPVPMPPIPVPMPMMLRSGDPESGDRAITINLNFGGITLSGSGVEAAEEFKDQIMNDERFQRAVRDALRDLVEFSK